MGRRPLRGIWFRAVPQMRREKPSLLLSVLIGLSLAFLLINCFNAALRPQMIAFAESQIQNRLNLISTQVISRVMSEQSLGYSDLVILQAGQGGEVSTMSVDAPKLNLLRAETIKEITDQILELDGQDLGIPLGLLTGIDVLSAAGPRLPVRVTSVASANGLFRNEFTDAGINQTLHRIMLDVTITAKLLLPVGVFETQITTPICISEAIVIGKVPQTYLNWNQ
ncbi:MAG: sporulation protein YunB [Oscillospiraceae bacterium]|nr:sporulation protein YunB [Oscillospiraceae bacterium]